jgi:hypothetical protein
MTSYDYAQVKSSQVKKKFWMPKSSQVKSEKKLNAEVSQKIMTYYDFKMHRIKQNYTSPGQITQNFPLSGQKNTNFP